MTAVDSSTHVEQQASNRFEQVDGLRAIAAILVLLHHASLPSNTQRFGHFSHQLTQMDIGVAIFFVISGFVLYRPFATRILRGDVPEPPVSQFLLRRAVRIFPAYWFALTVIIVIGKVTDGRLLGLPYYPSSKLGYLPYYLLVHTYRNFTEAAGGINQAWTLAVEITFYVFVPCFAFAIRKIARSRTRTPTQRYGLQLGALAVMAVCSIAFRSYTYWGHNARISAIGEYWLPANLDLFAIGMAVAVISAGTEVGIEAKRLVSAIRAVGEGWWLIAIAIFWFASNLVDAGIYPRPEGWEGLFKQEFHGVVAGLMLLPIVFAPQRSVMLDKLLRWKPLAFCGVVSYGVYLWHQAWVGQASRWQYETVQRATGSAPPPEMWFGASMPLLVVFGLTASILAATISWYALERPLMRYMARRRQR